MPEALLWGVLREKEIYLTHATPVSVFLYLPTFFSIGPLWGVLTYLGQPDFCHDCGDLGHSLGAHSGHGLQGPQTVLTVWRD